MEIYNKLADLKSKYPKLVVALGMFDGVHTGHQSIIQRAVELAQKIGGKSLVFTFSNHPLSVLAPDRMPPQIGNNFLRQARAMGDGILQHDDPSDMAADTVEDLIAMSAITAGFSRLLAEKLLLLQDKAMTAAPENTAGKAEK